MRKATIVIMALLSAISSTVSAQNAPDSLTKEIRSYVTRNFSESRTFNFYWRTSPDHDYTLKRNGSEIEEGEMQNIHTMQLSGTVPIVARNKFSIFANWQANFYQFEAVNDISDGKSSVFLEDCYSYHRGTISANYKTRIWGKPLLLNANISGDGWNEGFEKIQGSLSAIILLKQTQNSSFSVGLYGTTLSSITPVAPIISYSHRFTPNLSLDIVLPTRAYIRYEYLGNHRISIGGMLESEQFYLKPHIDDLPKTCFYSKTVIRPEVVYEYIINKHFYLVARGGGSAVLRGGLYDTKRKGDDNDPFIKMKHSMTSSFSLGVSYSLF